MLSVGMVISILLIVFSPLKPPGTPGIPLLAALFMCEIGLILTLVGAWISGRDLLNKRAILQNSTLLIGNILVALNLLTVSLEIWPDTL